VPGSLKLFIDACSVREYKQNFKGKKAALVGIASGRAGNLRGMDHLTGVMFVDRVTNQLALTQELQKYGFSAKDVKAMAS
jgi:NAD(P)H-dependent FMN reductase